MKNYKLATIYKACLANLVLQYKEAYPYVHKAPAGFFDYTRGAPCDGTRQVTLGKGRLKSVPQPKTLLARKVPQLQLFCASEQEVKFLKGIRSFATAEQHKCSEVSSTFTSSALKKAIKSLIGNNLKKTLNPHTLLHYNTKSVVYSFNKVNKLNPLIIDGKSTEYLLKSILLSMFSLISRPVFVIKHDKIIIRLFVFLSPKIDKYLDTSTYFAWRAGSNNLTGKKLPPQLALRPAQAGGALNTLANNSTIKVPVKIHPASQLNKADKTPRFSTDSGARDNKQVGIPSVNLKRLFRKAATYAGVSMAPSPITLKKFLKFKKLRAKPVEILKSQIKLQLESSKRSFGSATNNKILPDYVSSPTQPLTPTPNPQPPTPNPQMGRGGEGSGGEGRGGQLWTCSYLGVPIAKNLALAQSKTGLATGAWSPNLGVAASAAAAIKGLPRGGRQQLTCLFPGCCYKEVWAACAACAGQEKAKGDPNLKVGTSVANPTNSYPYTSWVSNFKNTLEKLSVIFGKIFNKKVEFEIIKAQLPYQDSNILAQILGHSADKYKFRRMLKIVIPRAVIKNPSKEPLEAFGTGTPNVCNFKTEGIGSGLSADPFLSTGSFAAGTSMGLRSRSFMAGLRNRGSLAGMNIKLAGRLMTQSIRPRFTVQSLQEGSLARVKVHFIEKSRFTGKNKRGAFSFTVTISHVFN